MTEGIPDDQKPADPQYRATADLAANTLRTAFPAIWAIVVAWLVKKIPAIGDLANGPAGAAVSGVILTLLIAAIYVVFRKLERQTWVPKWLVLVLLGNATQPLQVSAPVANAVQQGNVVDLVAARKGDDTDVERRAA